MRIHSDILSPRDIYSAPRGTDLSQGYGCHTLPGVHADVTAHGSRSHLQAFELRLEGNGYARNTGTRGADAYETGATWDEWGVVIARIFAIDPNAVFGSVKHPVYRDAEHFHRVTAGRFESLDLPSDTHKRHNWDHSLNVSTCTKCSAELWRD